MLDCFETLVKLVDDSRMAANTNSTGCLEEITLSNMTAVCTAKLFYFFANIPDEVSIN